MPRRFPWLGVLGLGGVSLAALVSVVYLKWGAGSKKNSAVIPDMIEDEIDKVVDFLNKKYPGWASKGMETLSRTLESTLPPTFGLLLKIVEQVEQQAAKAEQPVSGPEKRRRAVDLFKQWYSAAA